MKKLRFVAGMVISLCVYVDPMSAMEFLPEDVSTAIAQQPQRFVMFKMVNDVYVFSNYMLLYSSFDLADLLETRAYKSFRCELRTASFYSCGRPEVQPFIAELYGFIQRQKETAIFPLLSKMRFEAQGLIARLGKKTSTVSLAECQALVVKKDQLFPAVVQQVQSVIDAYVYEKRREYFMAARNFSGECDGSAEVSKSSGSLIRPCSGLMPLM